MCCIHEHVICIQIKVYLNTFDYQPLEWHSFTLDFPLKLLAQETIFMYFKICTKFFRKTKFFSILITFYRVDDLNFFFSVY